MAAFYQVFFEKLEYPKQNFFFFFKHLHKKKKNVQIVFGVK